MPKPGPPDLRRRRGVAYYTDVSAWYIKTI